MLYKYKKCYQETNKNTIDPPSCIKLVKIESEDNFETPISYSYRMCDDNSLVESSFIATTKDLNICIVEGSLLILGNDSVTITTDLCVISPLN